MTGVKTRTVDGIRVGGRTYKVWLHDSENLRALRIDVTYAATTGLGSSRTVVRSIAPGGRVGQTVAAKAREVLQAQEQPT